MHHRLVSIVMLVATVSCGKVLSPEAPVEIRLSGVNCLENTRGYVSGTVLDGSDNRVIHLSAYDITESLNYLTGERFRKQAEGDSWVADPALYWRFSDRMDFLAYSTSSSSPVAVWDRDNVSGGLELVIDEGSLRDDILYASARDLAPVGEVNLEFRHAQAFVDFSISNNTGSPVTVNKVTISKALTYGRLRIDNAGSSPVLSWDTSETVPSVNCTAMPSEGAATVASGSKVSAWVLLPYQKVADGVEFYLDVTIDDTPKTITLQGCPTNYWQPAKHYIYNVTLNPGVLSSSRHEAGEGQTIRAEVSLTECEW